MYVSIRYIIWYVCIVHIYIKFVNFYTRHAWRTQSKVLFDRFGWWKCVIVIIVTNIYNQYLGVMSRIWPTSESIPGWEKGHRMHDGDDNVDNDSDYDIHIYNERKAWQMYHNDVCLWKILKIERYFHFQDCMPWCRV